MPDGVVCRCPVRVMDDLGQAWDSAVEALTPTWTKEVKSEEAEQEKGKSEKAERAVDPVIPAVPHPVIPDVFNRESTKRKTPMNLCRKIRTFGRKLAQKLPHALKIAVNALVRRRVFLAMATLISLYHVERANGRHGRCS